VALVTTKILTKYFGGVGLPGRASVTTAIGTVVGAVLLLALIPPFGIRGAAIASSPGYIATALAAIVMVQRAAPGHTLLFRVDRADVRWLIAQFRGLRRSAN